MKLNRLFSILGLAAMLSLSACEELFPEKLPEDGDFSGTVKCLYEGSWNSTPAIKASIVIADDKKTADITLYQIKFVPQMPVTIDVTIPGATLKADGDDYNISGNNIIPTMANGVGVEQYIVTNLTGELSDDELEFELNFGPYATEYEGMRL